MNRRETTIHSYDAAALQRLLAHRHPFLFVDRIDVEAAGKRVVGIKQLTASEWWSGQGISTPVPYTLVLEALAQTTAGLLAGLVAGAEDAVGYFMAADRVRLRHPARAGDTLRLEVTLRQWKRGICKTHGVATLAGANEQVVLTADLTTIVR